MHQIVQQDRLKDHLIMILIHLIRDMLNIKFMRRTVVLVDWIHKLILFKGLELHKVRYQWSRSKQRILVWVAQVSNKFRMWYINSRGQAFQERNHFRQMDLVNHLWWITQGHQRILICQFQIILHILTVKLTNTETEASFKLRVTTNITTKADWVKIEKKKERLTNIGVR